MSMTSCFCFSSSAEDEFHINIIYHQYCFESSIFEHHHTFFDFMTSCEITRKWQNRLKLSKSRLHKAACICFKIIVLPVVLFKKIYLFRFRTWNELICILLFWYSFSWVLFWTIYLLSFLQFFVFVVFQKGEFYNSCKITTRRIAKLTDRVSLRIRLMTFNLSILKWPFESNFCSNNRLKPFISRDMHPFNLLLV